MKYCLSEFNTVWSILIWFWWWCFHPHWAVLFLNRPPQVTLKFGHSLGMTGEKPLFPANCAGKWLPNKMRDKSQQRLCWKKKKKNCLLSSHNSLHISAQSMGTTSPNSRLTSQSFRLTGLTKDSPMNLVFGQTHVYVQFCVPWVPLEKGGWAGLWSQWGAKLLQFVASEQWQEAVPPCGCVGASWSSDNEAGCLIKSHEACTQKKPTSKASTLPLLRPCTHAFDHGTNATVWKPHKRPPRRCSRSL